MEICDRPARPTGRPVSFGRHRSNSLHVRRRALRHTAQAGSCRSSAARSAAVAGRLRFAASSGPVAPTRGLCGLAASWNRIRFLKCRGNDGAVLTIHKTMILDEPHPGPRDTRSRIWVPAPRGCRAGLIRRIVPGSEESAPPHRNAVIFRGDQASCALPAQAV